MSRLLILIILSAVLMNCTSSLHAQNRQSADEPESSGQEPMYMLTYDHGGLILWGSEHFEERLQDAALWLDKYPGFKIGLDNEAHMYDYLAEYNKDVLSGIKSKLASYPDRFGIGSCTYGQPLSQFINEESNIRQIGYALRTTKKHFDFKPTIYLMSEHAMHSQIPQIISGFEFEGAIMRTHFMMYGYNPTYKESFGWWVGMDGSRIPTVPTYEGEGAEFFKTTVDNWILTRYPGTDAKESLQDYRNQFSHINPLLATRADDSGLREEELVREYEGNPLFRWILLEELLDLYPKPSAEFVTKPDDFKVRMPWGYCGNLIWNTSRKAEVQLLTAERLAAFEFLNKGLNREDLLHKAWENLLVAQHHDIQIVGLTDDADRYLTASLAASEDALNSSLGWAASQMSAFGKQQVTIFNPVSWERTQWFETKISFEKGQAHSISVRLDEDPVPLTYLNTHRFSDGSIYETTIAFAATLPPLSLTGYSVVPVSENIDGIKSGLSADQNELSITTPFYHVMLDPRGGISSLEQRDTKMQLFDQKHRSAYFCGMIDGEELESSGRWVISKTNENSPWVTATEYGFIANIPYTFTLQFYGNSPRIDCAVEFNFDGQKIGQLSDDKRDRESPFIHKKKLRFKCFPLLTGNISGIKDLPFLVTETNNINVEGNYWTALVDHNQGLAYFNKGNMGSVREEDGGFSIPLSYAMYYIWGTRMLQGNYNYEFALFPFQNSWQSADLHREAISYNYPAVYTINEPGTGVLGNQVDLLEMNSVNVILSALYVENKKVFVRMYEGAGESAGPAVLMHDSTYKLHPVNLNGESIANPKKNVQFTPWQIRTFEIKQNSEMSE